MRVFVLSFVWKDAGFMEGEGGDGEGEEGEGEGGAGSEGSPELVSSRDAFRRNCAVAVLNSSGISAHLRLPSCGVAQVVDDGSFLRVRTGESEGSGWMVGVEEGVDVGVEEGVDVGVEEGVELLEGGDGIRGE
jgi:hypothetical protein